MNRSEIFEEFAKIAQEKKLISKNSSESFKKLENNPRADSLDISAIEALYGVKPKAPNDMDYKNNIMEIAHPSSKVVSPAYDKINGLVENNIERQNINLRIVNKNPDGLLTQRKYAEQQLLFSLVRTANDLDNKNETKLANLADNCLKHASQQFTIKKQAGAMFWIATSLIGMIAAYNNTSFLDEGFESNHNTLLAELDDLINEKMEYGIGLEYDQTFKDQLVTFKGRAEKIKKIYDENKTYMQKLDSITSAKQLKALTKDKTLAKRLIDASGNLEKELNDFVPEIQLVEKFFSDPEYKKRQIKDKGLVRRYFDKLNIGPVGLSGMGGGYGLFGDDFQDVRNALPTYTESLKNVINRLKTFNRDKKTATANAQKSFSASISKSSPIFKDDKSKPKYDDDKNLPSLEDVKQQAVQEGKKQVRKVVTESFIPG